MRIDGVLRVDRGEVPALSELAAISGSDGGPAGKTLPHLPMRSPVHVLTDLYNENLALDSMRVYRGT